MQQKVHGGRFNLRLPLQLQQRLDKESARSGLSKAELVRMALDDLLERREARQMQKPPRISAAQVD